MHLLDKHKNHLCFDQSIFSISPLPHIFDTYNQNLTGSQKELLLWHQRLGHASLKHIQELCAMPRDGTKQIITPHNQRVSICDLVLPLLRPENQYWKQREVLVTIYWSLDRRSQLTSTNQLSLDVFLTPKGRNPMMKSMLVDQYFRTLHQNLFLSST
jgi:hypothetical protein